METETKPKASVPNYAREIGERIRFRRRELDWSQQIVADQFGVSREYLSRIEAGKAEINSGDLPKMAAILKVPVGYFYMNITQTSMPDLNVDGAPVQIKVSGKNAVDNGSALEAQVIAWLKAMTPSERRAFLLGVGVGEDEAGASQT